MNSPIDFPRSKQAPIAAVIAVVLRDDEVLLVSRKNPPDVGLWGFPGGKMEFGESIEEAAVRELLEETGVHAEARSVLTALNAYDRNANNELVQHFVLLAVLCEWQSGEPVAADDAEEAGWFSVSSLSSGALALSADVQEVALLAIQARALAQNK